MERYKRLWNLKIQGLKVKGEENTCKEVLDILAKIAPQHTSAHCDGYSASPEEEGSWQHRQIIIQFTMRH